MDRSDENAIPFKVKVVKIGNSQRMMITKPIVDYLEIIDGDILTIMVQNHEM